MSARDNGNLPAASSQEVAELRNALQLLVEQQTEEAKDRQAERDIRRLEIETNKEVALRSIDAQQSDRAEQMQRYGSLMWSKYIFVIICIVLILGFFIAGMYLEQGTLVGQLATTAGTAAVSIFGGYGVGKSAGIKQAKEQQSSE